jgi:hypothetical protein
MLTSFRERRQFPLHDNCACLFNPDAIALRGVHAEASSILKQTCGFA